MVDAPRQDLIKLTFLGDMMCLMQQIAAIRRSKMSYDEVFAGVKGLWADSDYVIGNLETPVSPSSCEASGMMTFNAPKSFAQAMKAAGIDFVSLANNHCMDRGAAGLDETITVLRSLGIESSGAYLTRDDSEQVFLKNVAGVRVALVCSTYGINGLDEAGLPQKLSWKVDTLTRGSITHVPERHKALRRLLSKMIPDRVKLLRRVLVDGTLSTGIDPVSDSIHPCQINRSEDAPCVARVRDRIKAAKASADVVIALPHVGGQYNFGPGAFQKHTVQWMLESGADVIVANHAHRPLRAETFPNGTFVAYALGNFCFTPGVGYYVPNVLADYSIVLNVFIDRVSHKVCRVSFHTVKSVVRKDGVAVVMPVAGIYAKLDDVREREQLAMENEAVVNCFRGGNANVDVADEYEIELGGLK